MLRSSAHRWMTPFLDACAEAFVEGRAALRLDTDDNIAWMLLEQQCESAVLSPAVVALHTGELSIVPNAAVSALGPTGDILLVFNPDLRRIETVGARKPGSLDAMLAGVVLREKHKMNPAIRPFETALPDALSRFDAVLVTEEDLACENRAFMSHLDLVDEWFDMTQLPFVRAVTAGWDHLIDASWCETIGKAAEIADERSISALGERLLNRSENESHNSIPGHYRFVFNDDAQRGLDAFFRLCFYHGLYRDIPVFRLWASETAEGEG